MSPARWFAGSVFRALTLWARALVFWAAVGLIPGIELPSFRAALLTTADHEEGQARVLGCLGPQTLPRSSGGR